MTRTTRGHRFWGVSTNSVRYGFYPTWFTLDLSVLLMVGLISGREWPFDRSQILESKCENFWSRFRQSVTVYGLFGQLVV